MSAKYLLDSTILIDHLNGIEKSTRWLAQLKNDEAVISAITRAEVMAKAGDLWEQVATFLDDFPCLTIGTDETDMAAAFRNKYKIKLPDAFQASLAKTEELILVTRDETDFKKVTELKTMVPYKL